MIKKIAIILSMFLLSLTLTSCSMLEDVVGSVTSTSIVGNKYEFSKSNIKLNEKLMAESNSMSPMEFAELLLSETPYIKIIEIESDSYLIVENLDGERRGYSYHIEDNMVIVHQVKYIFVIKTGQLILDYHLISESHQKYYDEANYVFKRVYF